MACGPHPQPLSQGERGAGGLSARSRWLRTEPALCSTTGDGLTSLRDVRTGNRSCTRPSAGRPSSGECSDPALPSGSSQVHVGVGVQPLGCSGAGSSLNSNADSESRQGTPRQADAVPLSISRRVGQARFERWPTMCDAIPRMVGLRPKRLVPPYITALARVRAARVLTNAATEPGQAGGS